MSACNKHQNSIDRVFSSNRIKCERSQPVTCYLFSNNTSLKSSICAMCCHLRPPDTIRFLTYNILGPRETSDLISMVSFTFIMRRHFIRLTSAPFIFSRLAKFGWVLFAVCNSWQQDRRQNLRRRRLFVLSSALARLSLSGFVQKIFAIITSLEVVEKPNKCKSFFGSQFLGGTTVTFLRQIVSTIYRQHFGKVWLSSVCWSPSAKPGNEL